MRSWSEKYVETTWAAALSMFVYICAGHNFNFCGDLPSRASEIQLSLALLKLSPILERLHVS